MATAAAFDLGSRLICMALLREVISYKLFQRLYASTDVNIETAYYHTRSKHQVETSRLHWVASQQLLTGLRFLAARFVVVCCQVVAVIKT